jgi:hypothetical protein
MTLKNRTKTHTVNAQIRGKYKQLELWWQMYVTSLSQQDVQNFQAARFSSDRVYWLSCSCVHLQELVLCGCQLGSCICLLYSLLHVFACKNLVYFLDSIVYDGVIHHCTDPAV